MRALQVAFLEGGPTMYLVLLFALASHGAAVAGAAAGGFSRRERATLFGGVSLGLALLTLAFGWYGYHRGSSMGHAAVELASPDVRDRLLAQCELEARHNLSFALYTLIVPGLLGAIMLARAATLGESRDPALPPR